MSPDSPSAPGEDEDGGDGGFLDGEYYPGPQWQQMQERSEREAAGGAQRLPAGRRG